MKLTVRRAEIEDVSSILNLLIQVDMVHHLGRPDLFKGPATKYSREELIDVLDDNTDNDRLHVFVCTDEKGKVLGHAFCKDIQVFDDNVLTDIKTLYIDDICVDKKYRKMNVGRTIYDYLISFARNGGYYNVTLNVWECNPGARKFYESLGMQPQKITMEKILGE